MLDVKLMFAVFHSDRLMASNYRLSIKINVLIGWDPSPPLTRFISS